MHLFRASFRHILGSGNELVPKVLSGHAQVTWRVLEDFGGSLFCCLGSKPSGNMDFETCKESKETSETVRSVF